MTTRREELITRLIGIGFDEEKAVQTYERYLHENKSEDLEWYIRLFEGNAKMGQTHSER